MISPLRGSTYGEACEVHLSLLESRNKHTLIIWYHSMHLLVIYDSSCVPLNSLISWENVRNVKVMKGSLTKSKKKFVTHVADVKRCLRNAHAKSWRSKIPRDGVKSCICQVKILGPVLTIGAKSEKIQQKLEQQVLQGVQRVLIKPRSWIFRHYGFHSFRSLYQSVCFVPHLNPFP